ncbi:PhzF family isomerase [Acetanaerobacterium elongatum]|uniref:Phenazine biosynthesis protein PhzF family n=1 Tax=Acetanaerobacterium elongatum TaxID=258515 RepID=A0A1H0AK43_9FIRM|nr:PhzF family isomerase [Acetanaerobacterium elongatum]SDN33714.1 phenazine biosynthesis protein PhzF family [Acetanaerobacterium elongatum]
MKNLYRIYQIDSFTKERLTGNPAGVVTNANGLSDQQMQKIARELNNSETAFVFNSEDDTYDVEVRFFTPTKEVPICGHATIAAHYARAIENHLGTTRVLQKTGAGILPVDIVQENDDYKIVMTQGKIEVREALSPKVQQALAAALGISLNDIMENCPVAIASTGHSKVMIGIKEINMLHSLRPNMDILANLSGEIGCNGYYVFTMNQNETPMIHGRMFAPAIGINEDPVTGNANGPLGAYLVHYGLVPHNDTQFAFNIVQGEAIGRAGTMEVQVKIKNNQPIEVKIAGNAVIAFCTELVL